MSIYNFTKCIPFLDDFNQFKEVVCMCVHMWGLVGCGEVCVCVCVGGGGYVGCVWGVCMGVCFVGSWCQ